MIPPVQPCQRAHGAKGDEDRAGPHHRHVAFACIILGRMKARNQSGHTEDQKDVCRVRADDVPEGKARCVVDHCLDRDDQLGRRGAESDDCEADNQGRNAKSQRQVHRAANKEITRHEKKRQPQKCRQPDHAIRLSRRDIRPCRSDGVRIWDISARSCASSSATKGSVSRTSRERQ